MKSLVRRHGVLLAVSLMVLAAAGTARVAIAGGTGQGMVSGVERASGLVTGEQSATPAGGDPAWPDPNVRPTQASDVRAVGPAKPVVPVSVPPTGGRRDVPTLAPAAPQEPNLVHRGGQTLLCPSGIVPMAQIQGVTFSPALSGGTSFGVGHYTIKVRGRVANETTAPIALRSLQITVGGRPWQRTSTVVRVAAQDFAPLTFEGTYDSTRPHRAVVDSRLQWQWFSAALRPCGEEGLVEDD